MFTETRSRGESQLTMKKFTDQQTIDAWNKNAQAWITAVRQGEIETRLLATNQAIVDAILRRAPQTVLDVGCGEGWLIRELCGRGINALGIDIVPGLIDSAVNAGVGRFRCLAYAEVSSAMLDEQFDVVVCNFSLLGKESVEQLFQHVPALLNEGGAFIIQTIHPVTGCGDLQYADGWREGSWAGFSDNFTDPAPWYFRTLDSWKALFIENGFTLPAIVEPMNPKTNLPASIVFIGELVQLPD
jgi:2-polyprenyl-3-methyl-5-hydroxy-6-metoxy-1,4-benzoquinol methylase